MRFLLIVFIVTISITLGYFGKTKPVQNVMEKTSNVVNIELTPEQKKKAMDAINSTEEAAISAIKTASDYAIETVESLPEKE
ncbi:MAG: hypothetical protein KKB03_00430 [Nanoarchaeota archaeon]|nr:hypothetical protein [Nanoarchaeota archaeon]MBU1135453.1 hypothetical protein [Nanoarchaeota archaeon]MBU2519695.1 hypothetical protein [Nanoarchaeota archaeon]